MEKTVQFKATLISAIRAGLEEKLGKNTAKAVEFYVDPAIAAASIKEFTVSLEKIFKEGARVLEEKCAENLYVYLGLEFQKKENFRLHQYVEDARKRLETCT